MTDTTTSEGLIVTVTTAADVAAYILEKGGPMTAMKLQKLVYYSQAWSLVWDDSQLFDDRIEAWANGPVVPSLYALHAGSFMVSEITPSNSGALDEKQRETVDRIREFYGPRSSQWLSDLTHRESPWLDARKGIPEGTRSSEEITLASMAEYYGGL